MAMVLYNRAEYIETVSQSGLCSACSEVSGADRQAKHRTKGTASTANAQCRAARTLS